MTVTLKFIFPLFRTSCTTPATTRLLQPLARVRTIEVGSVFTVPCLVSKNPRFWVGKMVAMVLSLVEKFFRVVRFGGKTFSSNELVVLGPGIACHTRPQPPSSHSALTFDLALQPANGEQAENNFAIGKYFTADFFPPLGSKREKRKKS